MFFRSPMRKLAPNALRLYARGSVIRRFATNDTKRIFAWDPTRLVLQHRPAAGANAPTRRAKLHHRGDSSSPSTFSLGAMRFTATGAWDWWRGLNPTRFVAAPMVDQSELAFRMLCRELGVGLCYTPMLHARLMTEHPAYKKLHFDGGVAGENDRPLFGQLAGHDPQVVLQAAQLIEDSVSAVDLNFGCPQANPSPNPSPSPGANPSPNPNPDPSPTRSPKPNQGPTTSASATASARRVTAAPTSQTTR